MIFVRVVLLLCLVGFANGAFASTEVPLHIDLKAVDIPIVGDEGTVTATVSADYDLPDATVEIVLPAECRSGKSTVYQVSKISKSAPVEFQAKVRFTTPGLKTIRAVVRSQEKPGVVWSAVSYLLLDVGDKSSSVVTDTRGIRPRPKQTAEGSGEKLNRPAADRSAGAPIPLAVGVVDDGQTRSLSEEPQPSSSDLIVSGKWSFEDRAGNTVGQRNHRVELVKTLPLESVIAVTYTDWEGNFVFPAVHYTSTSMFVRCATSWDGPDYEIHVVDPSVHYFSADTDVFSFASSGYQSVGHWVVDSSNPNYKAWWISDDMIKAATIPPDSTGHHTAMFTPAYNGGAHYEPGGRVYLYADDVDDSPDTVLHEMGHSVQYNIYGDYLPNVGGAHSLFERSSPELAWIEGWATAWAFWVTNDPVFNFPGGGSVDMENRTWGDGGDEGYDVEGRVTGALWDIADAVDDGNDTYSGGWLDIWHIMYNHNCDTFYEFWQQWLAHPAFNSHEAVACIYQNTINWNNPPTFGGMPNITVPEDQFLAGAIYLDNYASDVESEDYQLHFGIVNVSTPNLQIGIDAQHRVNLQGVTNWSGTATVEIWCHDSLATTPGNTFTVTVTPVNDPPLIQNVPDKTLNEDASLYHAINLSKCTTDPETLSTSLTYTITGNTNSSCGVTLDGYYVNINPVANWFGASDVTIRAADPQGLWSEDTFRITVNSVNDPPVISGLPNRVLNEDTTLTNSIDLWAYTTDIEIPASALSYYVQSSELPDGTVTISSNRYVNITPPENYSGSGNVTIRVWDWEQGYDEDTFMVTVNPVNDPPTLDVPDKMYTVSHMTTTRLVDLHQCASDPDVPVTELTFSVTGNTNPGIGASIYNGHYLRITQGAFFSGHSQVTVRVTDAAGIWTEDTLNVVVGFSCSNCSSVFNLPDNTFVVLTEKPVTVSHYFGFYIEDILRTSGIRVNSTAVPEINRNVTVGGRVTTYQGERAIDCLGLAIGDLAASPPEPFYMNHKAMGGVWSNSNTPAVPTNRSGGVYNVGLLVRTTGTVVSRNMNSFWIADGSGVQYSFANKGLYVDCQPIAMYAPTLGSRVVVTGVSGATTLLDDTVVNALRLRNRVDVKGLGGKALYIYNSDAATAVNYSTMLAEYGWKTTRISLSQLVSHDISGYDVVILGKDTGTWSDMAGVNHIVNSDRPVIAVGSGGAKFLDQVPNLYIGWLNSAYFNISQGYVNDLSNVLYWWDNIISVPTNKTLSLLAADTSCISLSSPPSGVYGLLRHPTNSAYWIVAQQGHYMQWGLEAVPANMNTVAKDLFVNGLYFMQGK